MMPIFFPKIALVLSSMGSLWHVNIVSSDKSTKADLLEKNLSQKLIRYEETFSDWLESSELRRHEKFGLVNIQRGSPLFLEGLVLAKKFYDLSGGLLDITTGALTWHVLDHPVGMKELRIDNNKFSFKKDPKRLSFGAFVKGWALGDIGRSLKMAGFKEFFIDAGGSSQLKVYMSASGNTVAEFYSSSSPLQNGHQHIFNPHKSNDVPNDSVKMVCKYELSSEDFDWRAMGAQSDALSTIVVLNPAFVLPKECTQI